MISASALLGVMAFLIAHERIRQPMKSIAATKSPSSRFIEQQGAKTFNQPNIAEFNLGGNGARNTMR
jgi:hypothetical protein